MKARTHTILFGTVVVAVLTVFSFAAGAQDKPAETMEIVREKIRADKKLLIAENMQLTESEAKAFWPVYDGYQARLQKLTEHTLALIQDYGDHYLTMSDEAARKLVGEYLAIQAERVKLMQTFLPKFRQVLPEKKVMRYYQLENKISAVVDYALAANIPLVK